MGQNSEPTAHADARASGSSLHTFDGTLQIVKEPFRASEHHPDMANDWLHLCGFFAHTQEAIRPSRTAVMIWVALSEHV